MTQTHSTDFELNRDGGTLSVHVPMTFRKRGGRKLVISPAGTPDTPPNRPGRSSSVDESLVRSLAHAFQWKQQLEDGEYATVADLAKAQKLDRSFVGRTLRLTLLAPAIVEAILDGGQQDIMQRQDLLHGFPLEWCRQ